MPQNYSKTSLFSLTQALKITNLANITGKVLYATKFSGTTILSAYPVNQLKYDLLTTLTPKLRSQHKHT